MNLILPGICSTVLVLLHLSVNVEPLIVRRHYHDGVLYEDYASDSDNVQYTTTNGEGWDDLDSLVATYGLRGKSMFCSRGPGAWLLYQEKEYQYGSMRQLKLLYGEHCVPADNINSLQPLGAVYVNIDDYSALIAFAEKYFAAKGETSRDTISQSIKSAIFVGTGSWTLEIDGKKTCVTILNLGDVCFLEDIQNTFSGTGEQVSITKGCAGDDTMEQYQLQTCYSTGYHYLTYDFGDYDPGDQAKGKFLEVVDLWKKRMNPKTETPSTVPNAAERLNTLNEMVNIMGKTCPGVSPAFLEIVKQIYIVHIKNGDLWNVTVTLDGTRIEQSHAKWARAQSFIMQCSGIDSVVDVGCTPEDISFMKNEKEIATIEDFLNGENYDYVIEHIWLLLNYVSTYCNFHMGFKNNDWSIFPLLFKRDFLYPLQEQWKNPGKWSTFYPVMFNGFEMEDERKSMISCVQAIIKQTPFYDPLARPPGFYRGNNTADRDIVGGVTPPSVTTTPAPTNRHKRQEVTKVNEETVTKGENAKESRTDASTAAPTTTTTHHPSSEPSTTTKKIHKHKQHPTIVTIVTPPKPTTLATSAADAAAVTQASTAIDSGVTTIVIGAPTTTGKPNDETTIKDKKKKKKKGKGKHGKKSKSKEGKEKEGEKHGSKLLKTTVVEMQQPPPVTEAESIVKQT